jgi:hypothetical protein
METTFYSIDRKTRHNLSKGSRIFNCLYGLILMTFGFVYVPKESSSIFPASIIFLGICSLAYGLIGKEPFITHDSLIMDSKIIKIRRSFQSRVNIKLSSITYIKSIPSGFEITFKDYVKVYDLSWLTIEELQMFKTKLQDYCKQNNILID